MATRAYSKSGPGRSREKRERLQAFELLCIYQSGQPVRLVLDLGTSCPTNKGVKKGKLGGNSPLGVRSYRKS